MISSSATPLCRHADISLALLLPRVVSLVIACRLTVALVAAVFFRDTVFA